jgi:hypothetical protein
MFDFLPRLPVIGCRGNIRENYSDFCELTGECGVSLFLTLAAVECGGVVTHLLQALRQHVRSLTTTTDDLQRILLMSILLSPTLNQRDPDPNLF